MFLRRRLPLLTLTVVLGCGDDASRDAIDASGVGDSGSVVDAGVDGGADSGLDASSDGGVDSGLDFGLDAGSDAGLDGGADSGLDAGTDSGLDSGIDAGIDAGTGTDAGVDAGVDAGIDAGMGICPGAPAGADAEQQEALSVVNAARLAMGVPCAAMVTALDTSATSHCQYYAAHEASSSCFIGGNPHTEVAACTQYFTGAQFWDRLSVVGYSASTMFENMAFFGNATPAVQIWIDSVYHRTPVLSPWVRDIGYGRATGCDTMDFGTGATTSSTATASYPYPGQTAVPRSFDGSTEGPTPPTPPSGWPSGYPITVFAKGLAEASMTHTLTVNGSATPIAHRWVTPTSSGGFLTDAFVLYADSPLAAQTTYRVQVQGVRGSTPVAFDFTFTTQ